MLRESAVVGQQRHQMAENLLLAIPIVVDVEHATYFVATAQMAVPKVGGSCGRAPIGRKERGFVVAIKRKDKLIRITLIQRPKSYSTRLMLTEVETLPSMKQINILKVNLSIKEIQNFH